MKRAQLMVLGALAIALVNGAPANAAVNDRISADVQSTPTVELTNAERAAMAHAASRMLLHATQARTALSDENIPEANDNIAKGLQLLDIINEALPEYKVTSKIAAGDLTYTDESHVKPGRVPIYTDYGELSILNDVAGTQDQETDGVVVADAEDYVSSVLLDVHAARSNFNAAKAAIENDDLTVADTFLAGVLGSLSYELTDVHRPLVAARENLIVAKDEVAESRWQAARMALEKASNEIDQQANRETGDNLKVLRDMATKVKALADDVEANAKTAPASIDEWHDQLAKMY